MKLTSKTITTLVLMAGKTDVIVFDSELSGFGYRLRRAVGGEVRRSWVVQYRRGGATRRLLLGSGAVLSAERARAAAKEALAQVQLGQDPQGDRLDRRGKDRLNMRAVTSEYLGAKEVRPRTRTEVTRYLSDARYFGALASMPIDSVRRKDVAARLTTICREHGNSAGARARGSLSALFSWSMQMGYREDNPVIGTGSPKENAPRERVLTDPELAAIWAACKDDAFGRIIKLLVLSGCRRSEIGEMRAGDLDLERGLFTIPAARSKNGRPHTLPLTPMMLDVLGSVPRMVSRDQLFGSRGPGGHSHWADGKRDLDKRSGVTGWVIHDIRRTVATRLADLGTAPHVIEQILNHVSGHKGGVAGIYNRSSYDREVKTALALWSDHVRALVEGGERRVLPFTAS